MSEEVMKKEEKKMTTDSHSRGSERIHSRRYEKKNAKADGRRLSQEEIDKELAEIRKELDELTMQLEENQRQGWVLMKKPMEWHEIQRRLQQKKVKWLREKLKEVELEMEESICELEQGEILGEGEDYTEAKKWISSEDLMDYWDSSKQHEEMLTEDEELMYKAIKPCVFEPNSFGVLAGCIGEDRQSWEVVESMEEYLTEDEYSEVKLNRALELKYEEQCVLGDKRYSRAAEYDEEDLSNEESIELLQQKELIDKLIIRALTRQEPFLVKEGDEVEPEELNHVEDSEQQGNVMTEEASKTARSYDFKINNLWMIVGTSNENEQTL